MYVCVYMYFTLHNKYNNFPSFFPSSRHATKCTKICIMKGYGKLWLRVRLYMQLQQHVHNILSIKFLYTYYAIFLKQLFHLFIFMCSVLFFSFFAEKKLCTRLSEFSQSTIKRIIKPSISAKYNYTIRGNSL